MKIYQTKEEFMEEKSEGLLMVDVFATWCGPCKVLGPAFEELAGEMADKAKFAKVDVDITSNIAEEYGVMTVPTIILFKDGEVVEQVSAVLSKDAMKSMILKQL